jgi:hypothetical protein
MLINDHRLCQLPVSSPSWRHFSQSRGTLQVRGQKIGWHIISLRTLRKLHRQTFIVQLLLLQIALQHSMWMHKFNTSPRQDLSLVILLGPNLDREDYRRYAAAAVITAPGDGADLL